MRFRRRARMARPRVRRAASAGVPLAVVFVICAAAVGAQTKTPAGAGQAPAKPKFRRNAKPTDPFGKPFQFFVPQWSVELQGEIREVLDRAAVLERIWRNAEDRGFDDEGRPTCRAPRWDELLAQMKPKLKLLAGHLGLVLRDHVRADRRRAAHFASLFVPRIQDVLDLVSYLPYEPDFSVRRDGLARVPPFVEHHAGARKPDGRYAYRFDYVPFADLARTNWIPDRVLALRVLTALARVRREDAAEAARRIQGTLRQNLGSKREALRRATREFLTALDPKHPCPVPAAEAQSHLEALLRRLFPDIDVRGGLCLIYPGPDRDAIVAKGRAWLSSGKAAFRDQVSLKDPAGMIAYGIRLHAPPPPLDKLGLKEGWLLTALDGEPLFTAQDIIRILKKRIAFGARSFLLEWVDEEGRRRARRYVLMKPRKP